MTLGAVRTYDVEQMDEQEMKKLVMPFSRNTVDGLEDDIVAWLSATFVGVERNLLLFV